MAPSGTQGSTCQACRLRHVACDREIPSCSRCRAAGRPCTQRFNVRFSTRRAWTPRAKPQSPTAPRLSSSPSPRPDPENPREHSGKSPQSDPEPSGLVRWSSEPQSWPFEAPPADHESPLEHRITVGHVSSDCRQDHHIEQLSSPFTLTSEDASLLQYFGDFIGRPW
ncbi:hypothetical protein BU16DRAFT_65043 [Lophium mytilinum]|uniref:Zn(2)-C6 fungal-type domain-containing protein n=1 Tax=Lophium mytilinum TaxID=390894 RepID=A0A6A6QPR1_9PEZI|nr:hypothetical protein BU16DRAFT_65043 [Lophium mytilinum]